MESEFNQLFERISEQEKLHMEIRNIKVTATYEEGEPSKFDALWKEYEIAKKIADTMEPVWAI